MTEESRNSTAEIELNGERKSENTQIKYELKLILCMDK